jgi:hypothetical protein
MAALARRIVPTFVAALLLIGAMAPAASASSAEGELLSLINAERTARGLGSLSMFADLKDDALAWSQHLMDQGSLSHNPNLASATSSWDKLGENVGVGPNVAALHTAFMASPSHRGNVLGDYDKVGIAVVEESPTKLWVTVVFMKSLGGAPAGDDPVPYSDQGPQPSNEQPVADTTNTRTPPQPAAAPTPAPTPQRVVASVAVGGRPIPD